MCLYDTEDGIGEMVALQEKIPYLKGIWEGPEPTRDHSEQRHALCGTDHEETIRYQITRCATG